MSALSRGRPPLRGRAGAARAFASPHFQYGRSPTYRRLSLWQHTFKDKPHGIRICDLLGTRSAVGSTATKTRSLPCNLAPFALASHYIHTRSALSQEARPGEHVRDPPRHEGATQSTEEPAEQSSSDVPPSQKSESSGEESKEQGEGGEQNNRRNQKKEEKAPPPPHGDKSPWQVFTDTLKTEFKASKEWNEGTKALASSAQDFTQNQTLQKARTAYGAASGAAASTTGKVLKTTGSAIGKSAAWTWDTTPVKGLRIGVNATGRGVEKITRPLRATEAFKNVRDVIDDGSSSRYGGWTEKDERKRLREARELKEAAKTGRPVRRAENTEEDPE